MNLAGGITHSLVNLWLAASAAELATGNFLQ
jgi:hypothetical protein